MPILVFDHALSQIYPEPGFVIKTKLVDTGMKTFVNICHHACISESGMVKKLDDEGKEVSCVGPDALDLKRA